MDLAAVLVAVLTLALGLVLGLVVGRSRADAAARDAVARAEEDGRQRTAAAEARAHEAERESARLTAVLEAERTAAQERVAAEAAVETRLREAFDSLAGQALQRNNEAFAELAEAKLASGAHVGQRRPRAAAAGDRVAWSPRCGNRSSASSTS